MPWLSIAAAAIPAVTSLIGGKKGADAASQASGAQVQSVDQAIGVQGDALSKIQAMQQQQYDTSSGLLKPYRDTGSTALNKLQAGLTGGVEGAAKKILSIFPSWSATGTPGNPGTAQQIVDSFIKHAPQIVAQGGEAFGEEGYGAATKQLLQELQPQMEAAQNAPDLLRKFTSADLTADPVYNSGLEFGKQQGVDAINARAIAGGGYDSGGAIKAGIRFANDYGSTKAQGAYDRFTGDQNSVYNKLMGVANIGASATGQTVAAGTNMANSNTAAQSSAANNISDLVTGAGNARAAGIVGGANAWSNAGTGVGNAVTNYQNSETLKKLLDRGNASSSYNKLYGGASYSDYSSPVYGVDTSGLR